MARKRINTTTRQPIRTRKDMWDKCKELGLTSKQANRKLVEIKLKREMLALNLGHV